MTVLHNMSVAPRSMLTLQREEVRGRRVRVAIGGSGWPDNVVLTRCFRDDGAACALAILQAGAPLKVTRLRAAIITVRGIRNATDTLRQFCETALADLRLPIGFGFFVEEAEGTGKVQTLSVAASIAILAARSGPLYLPGRFEPSLITAGVATLFFPSLQETEVSDE